MSKPVDLVVDFCDYQAAKYAVMNWHYSKTMPVGKLVKVGVWEDDIFIGCILFGRGANNRIGNPYNLKQVEVCELTRVALTKHVTPVSRIVPIALKKLKKYSSIRLIVSYADPEQRHLGVIYQAMNWLYVGHSQAQRFTLDLNGKIVHKKTVHSLRGTIKGLPKSKMLWKYKYLFPLDKAMRRQIEPLAKPYPKRADVGEIESQTVSSG